MTSTKTSLSGAESPITPVTQNSVEPQEGRINGLKVKNIFFGLATGLGVTALVASLFFVTIIVIQHYSDFAKFFTLELKQTINMAVASGITGALLVAIGTKALLALNKKSVAEQQIKGSETYEEVAGEEEDPLQQGTKRGRVREGGIPSQKSFIEERDEEVMSVLKSRGGGAYTIAPYNEEGSYGLFYLSQGDSWSQPHISCVCTTELQPDEGLRELDERLEELYEEEKRYPFKGTKLIFNKYTKKVGEYIENSTVMPDYLAECPTLRHAESKAKHILEGKSQHYTVIPFRKEGHFAVFYNSPRTEMTSGGVSCAKIFNIESTDGLEKIQKVARDAAESYQSYRPYSEFVHNKYLAEALSNPKPVATDEVVS